MSRRRSARHYLSITTAAAGLSNTKATTNGIDKGPLSAANTLKLRPIKLDHIRAIVTQIPR